MSTELEGPGAAFYYHKKSKNIFVFWTTINLSKRVLARGFIFIHFVLTFIFRDMLHEHVGCSERKKDTAVSGKRERERESGFRMFSRLGNCKSHSHNWTSCVLGTRRALPKWCTAKFVTIGDSRREDKVDNRIRFTNTTERNGDWGQICNDLPTYSNQDLPLSIWACFLSSTPCPHSL